MILHSSFESVALFSLDADYCVLATQESDCSDVHIDGLHVHSLEINLFWTGV